MSLRSFLKMKNYLVLLKCTLSDHPANVQLRRTLIIIPLGSAGVFAEKKPRLL